MEGRHHQRRAPLAVARLETAAVCRQALDLGGVAPGGRGMQAAISGDLLRGRWYLRQRRRREGEAGYAENEANTVQRGDTRHCCSQVIRTLHDVA